MIALDSGFLIAIERRNPRAQTDLATAVKDGIEVLVSAMVVAEVWREPAHPLVARALAGCRIAPVDDDLARTAGAACGATGAAAPDAIIAATAARAGAPLLTADPDDMHALADHFEDLRIIPL